MKSFPFFLHRKSQYYRLQAQLAICTLNAKKSEYTNKMIQNELKNYENLSGSIEQSIDVVKDNIESLKQEFALAKRIRKNRMEYDVLAKSIMSQPDRKETTKQLETLKNELKDLEDESSKLQRKIKSRQNDFFVLMRSIKELDSKLSSDDDSSSDSSSSDSDDIEGNMSVDDIIDIPLSPMKE